MEAKDRVRRTLAIPLIVVASFCAYSQKCHAIQEPSEYARLKELTLEERHDVFREYPMETQIKVYLYASTAVHPPQIEYAYDIAREGKDALEALNETLRQETSGLNQERLFYVYEVMSKFYYPVNTDEKTIALLSEVASKTAPPYQDRIQSSLKKILDVK